MSDSRKEQRRDRALTRLFCELWIGVEDWCAIHGVSRNTGFKAVAEGQVPGAYRAGKQIRIPTALERRRLGLPEATATSEPRAA